FLRYDADAGLALERRLEILQIRGGVLSMENNIDHHRLNRIAAAVRDRPSILQGRRKGYAQSLNPSREPRADIRADAHAIAALALGAGQRRIARHPYRSSRVDRTGGTRGIGQGLHFIQEYLAARKSIRVD